MIVQKIGQGVLAGMVIGGASVYMMSNANTNSSSSTVTSTMKTIDCAAEEAFIQGKKLLKSGDLSRAGLHFTRAMACDPGDWEQLQSYAKAILDHAKGLVEQGESEKAVGLASDLELFMRSQAQYLNLDELNQLFDSLEQIREERIAFLDKVQHVYQTVIPDDAYSDLENYVTRTTQKLRVKFERQKLEKLEGIDDDPLTLYQLGLIDASLQKLVLLSEFGEKKAKRQNGLLEMADSFQKLKEDISKEVSGKILTLLRKELTELNAGRIVDPGKSSDYRCSEVNNRNFSIGSTQAKIDARVSFGKKILREMAKISSKSVQKDAMDMLEYNQQRIVEIQHIQRQGYEQGAINIMKKFYEGYTKAVEMKLGDGKVFTDTVHIERIMKGNLAGIDTRLLSLNAQAGYNELFSMAYNKLEAEQKIKMSWEMAKIPKKPLCSF